MISSQTFSYIWYIMSPFTCIRFASHFNSSTVHKPGNNYNRLLTFFSLFIHLRLWFFPNKRRRKKPSKFLSGILPPCCSMRMPPRIMALRFYWFWIPLPWYAGKMVTSISSKAIPPRLPKHLAVLKSPKVTTDLSSHKSSPPPLQNRLKLNRKFLNAA